MLHCSINVRSEQEGSLGSHCLGNVELGDHPLPHPVQRVEYQEPTSKVDTKTVRFGVTGPRQGGLMARLSRKEDESGSKSSSGITHIEPLGKGCSRLKISKEDPKPVAVVPSCPITGHADAIGLELSILGDPSATEPRNCDQPTNLRVQIRWTYRSI